MTDDEEFSSYFPKDLKNLGTSAEKILKKVQDMIDGKSIPSNYIYNKKED